MLIVCQNRNFDIYLNSVYNISCFFQVLCNALWYTTNHHTTINDASKHKSNVKAFPTAFEEFEAFDNIKRKKMKSMPMKSSQLDGHSEALYSLLLKPIINSSVQWQKAGNEIKELAECLSAYSQYLKNQTKEMRSYHESEAPARTIDRDATVEHRHRCIFGVKKAYMILDEAVQLAEESKPVFFNEFEHVEKPFSTNKERAQFFEHLQLSVPIDIVKFSPGGSCVSIHCIFKVEESSSVPEMITRGARYLQTARPNLKEFHTRAQCRLFKEKLKNVASVLPSVSDLIYKEMTLDASVAAHPVTQERLRLIFLGNTGLITDLRTLNPGRPSGQFDQFFNALSGIIENITAADDRRHGVSHLSEFLSIDEMIKKAKAICPDDSPIPSKSLVRLQFAPRNPYAKTAQNFTSRLDVQYKIQRRQLRLSHPDEHYCNAQLKYIKERAIEQKQDCVLFFCDDKAKVPFGDPDHLISTGVRGRMSIVPTTSTLSSLDHDMTRASITPSVLLNCKIPGDINSSFVRGKVTTVINDSAFQTASPFRHNATIAKLLSEQDEVPAVLIKFTDGGTDQRNTLESVRCATICLFKELNFDMIILGRCAPGHSYINPAERIMSILNIGLQNVALAREASTDENETHFKKCNSMNGLRDQVNKYPELKQAWLESVEPLQSLIRNRFLRLSLKDEAFTAIDPLNDLDIDIFKRHLRELFPDLDIEKLVKAQTSKCLAYTTWVEKHCRLRHYTYQIRKCQDITCCSPTRLPYDDLKWLPDPVLADDGEHYLPYSQVKILGQTDETARPTLKQPKVQPQKKNSKGKFCINF